MQARKECRCGSQNATAAAINNTQAVLQTEVRLKTHHAALRGRCWARTQGCGLSGWSALCPLQQPTKNAISQPHKSAKVRCGDSQTTDANHAILLPLPSTPITYHLLLTCHLLLTSTAGTLPSHHTAQVTANQAISAMPTSPREKCHASATLPCTSLSNDR